MGCGSSFVKYVLFFFNLLFALGGLAILGIGVAFKLQVTDITRILEGRIDVPPLIFIIVGAVIFVIAFFGCCGAVRESHCMIVTYAVFLLIIIIVQVAVAILVFVYIGDVDSAISKVIKNAFTEAQSGNNEPAKEAFNSMQAKFRCCGANSPYDYPYGISLPPSCCTEEGIIERVTGTCTSMAAHSRGCISAFTDFVKVAGKTIAGVAIGVAVIEIIGAIFALCLANSIRNADRRYA